MRTKAKSRLTVVLILISFLVISVCSITAIFALTQQNTKTRVDIQYIADVVPLEAMTFTLSDDGTSYSVTNFDTSETGTVVVPKIYEGMPVTSIGDSVFKDANLTNVIIPNSVTSIGDNAFEFCSLQTITIPNSVTSIGDNAFRYCSRLTSIEIPNSLTVIEDHVFEYSGLTSIVIPNNVISIGSFAFESCDGLTTITISNSVTNIGIGVFARCKKLSNISVEEGNSEYHSEGNCLIETKSKKLLAGCKNSEIPTDGSVTSIGESAFEYCRDLSSITIPNSVTSIGDLAFFGCSGLTSIAIPNSVTNIGLTAFSCCSGLTSVEIPNSVTRIGNGPFSGCSKLTSITVEEGNSEYHSEGNCLIETKSKKLLAGCKNSEIPTDGSVTSIGYSAFKECSGLTSIQIPDSVTDIGMYAFSYCSGLTSIEIPNSVTRIGNGAFEYCRGISRITIPESVITIEYRAFASCSKLTNVTFENTIGWFVATSSTATSGTDLSSSELENESTAATYLISTYVSKYWKVKTVDLSLLTFSPSSDGTSYYITDCDTSATGMVFIPASYNELPVSIIGDGTFDSCTKLTGIVIPNSVISIGSRAFYYCKNLKKVSMANTVSSIGEYAFYLCSNLTTVKLSQVITTLPDFIFSNCTNLKVIEIPESVITIGDNAFWNCSSITDFVIPKNVNSIGEKVFGAMYGLSSLSVDNANEKYQSEDNCIIETATKTLIFGCNTSIIPLDGSVEVIADYAFYCTPSLTSITIPYSVRSIGYRAFEECKNLTSVTFKNTSGWFAANSADATSGVDLTTYLSDSQTAATYLTSTYYDKYWICQKQS